MIVKICKKHGELTKDQVWREKRNGMPDYLRCKACRQIKRIGRAYKCRVHGELTPDEANLQGGCLKCKREYAKNYKKNNKHKIKKRVQEDREKNPEKWKKIYKVQYKKDCEKYGALLSLKKVCDSRGITIEEYQEMVNKQDNKCAICFQKEARKDSRKSGEFLRLCIDHCHKTNKVRGLLCHACNTAIGKFKDSTVTMLRAIRYIKMNGDIYDGQKK